MKQTNFKLPPLDGSLTLPEIYDLNARQSPHHPIFIYAKGGTSDVCEISWVEAVRAVHRVAWILSTRVLCSSQDLGRPPVIAIVAASDTITYFLTMVGVMMAGMTVFTISPRNSPGAVAHLLTKAGVNHVLVGKETMLADLVDKATLELSLDHVDNITRSMMPIFEELFPHESQPFEKFPCPKYRLEDPALILHSSGSTAYPKPIAWNHLGVLQLARVPSYGARNLTGEVLGFHAVPMFHGMGVLMLNAVPATGLILAVFPPTSPAQLPSPDSTFNGAVATKSRYVFTVPAFLEAWSRDPEKVKVFQDMEGLIYGGGPLNKEVGDFLASKGISIFTAYGATEGGVMSTFLPASPGMDWEYFDPSPQYAPAFVPDSNGTSELVLVENGDYKPAVVNTKWNGRDAYATNDLLLPHPSKPGLWKVFGRVDDQIMLSTGEKTNPGPLESILLQDPHINAAVMFGRGRFQNGVILDPKAAYAFDPADEAKLVDFRNAIWKTVERLNQFAPTHSRLFKEMILVASPGKPFTYTAKSTARRQAILQDYQSEIDAVYLAVENSAQPEIETPKSWSRSECLLFIRQVVLGVMKRGVSDEDDIFQQGCDSLQATWIRNSILRALRSSKDTATKTISPQFVYDTPSIASLAIALEKVAHASTGDSNGVDSKIMEMKAMLTRYTHAFPSHVPRSHDKPIEGDVVLLTGGTGGLGSHLLIHLVASANISKVYVLNRSHGSGSGRRRQLEAFEDRGLDALVLDSPKVVLLEGDFYEADLGLEEQVITEIRVSVTHIIHNAWSVNFNLALASFEPLVKGVRHLVDLALQSPHHEPPRVMLISTIGTVSGAGNDQPVQEQFYEDPAVAIGAGYAESKWIAERILQEASKATTLKPTVVRVGQLSGGVNGSWNHTEWFPSLVRSSVFLRCLPDCQGDISWIPIDVAAAALVEMRSCTEPVVHLRHPRPVSWTSIFHEVSRDLDINLMPYQEWFKKLEQSLEDKSASEVDAMRQNPALRLLGFFRAGLKEERHREPPDAPKLSIDGALRASPQLRDVPQLGGLDVGLWLTYWRKTRFI